MAVNIEAIRAPGQTTEEHQPQAPAEAFTATRDDELERSLPDWIQQSQVLARAVGAEEVAQRIDSLTCRGVESSFRLAVVGEFNRGKSTLINRLLGRNLLPVGDVPITAATTSIVTGDPEIMEVHRPDQSIEKRDPAGTAWEDLLATTDSGGEREVRVQVRLRIDNDWLRRLDAEILDTPGVADLNSRRGAIASDVLNNCDAAVLVIAASSPFSLTEQAFLEEEVIGRSVPRIMVAVSKLDLVEPAERQRVFRSVCGKVARISPAIAVLPASPLDEADDSGPPVAKIRERITVLAAHSQRRFWRNWQSAGQLASHLSQLQGLAQLGASQSRLDESKRTEEAAKISRRFQGIELEWDKLRLDFEGSRQALSHQLRENLERSHQDLTERLRYELEHASDPRIWVERDLPYKLRSELLTTGRRFEATLTQAVARDVEGLRQSIAERFRFQTGVRPPVVKLPTPEGVEPRELGLKDLAKLKLWTRLGASAMVLTSAVLLAPAGLAVSMASGIAGERLIEELARRDRPKVQAEIERLVQATCDQYATTVSERLRGVYAEVAEQLRADQIAWRQGELSIIERQSPKSRDTREWERLAQTASALQQEIHIAQESGLVPESAGD